MGLLADGVGNGIKTNRAIAKSTGDRAISGSVAEYSQILPL